MSEVMNVGVMNVGQSCFAVFCSVMYGFVLFCSVQGSVQGGRGAVGTWSVTS